MRLPHEECLHFNLDAQNPVQKTGFCASCGNLLPLNHNDLIRSVRSELLTSKGFSQ